MKKPIGKKWSKPKDSREKDGMFLVLWIIKLVYFFKLKRLFGYLIEQLIAYKEKTTLDFYLFVH